MIQISDLKLSYRSKPVFELRDLTIPDSGVFLIIGGNGTGKSSLIKAIVGLIQPSQGKILIDGRDVREMSRLEIAKTASYLPQGFGDDTDLSGREFIRQGLYAHSSGESEFEAVCSVLDIGTLLDKPYSQMSGGEKQLCRIARSFVAPVKYGFLDEPDSYLSKKNKSRLLALIDRFRSHRSVVIVTHGDTLMSEKYELLLELDE